MNNLKKVNKILAVTLLVFSIIVLADYSKSASRYYKDAESIAFDTNLVRLYHTNGESGYQFGIKALESTNKEIAYKYEFDRNIKAFTDEELVNNVEEEYRIVVDEGCTIKSVLANGKNQTIPKDQKNQYRLTLENAPKENDRIYVDYVCPVDLSNNDDITTEVKVYEKISTDKYEFLFLQYSNKITKETYKKDILKEEGIKFDYDTMTVPKDTTAADIKIGVRDWLRLYISEYRTKNAENKDLQNIIIDGGPLSSHNDSYENPLIKYIYEAFGDFTDLKKNLLGLTITEDNDNYTFKIDDKFVGYALTDWHYQNPSKVFYFSNNPRYQSEIEEVFKYYVETYMKDDKDAVNTYFDSIGGIYKVLDGTTKVNPMILMYNGGRLLFMPNFLKDPTEVLWETGKEHDINSRRSSVFSTIYTQLTTLWPDEYPAFVDGGTNEVYMALNDIITTSHFGYNASSDKRDDIIFSDYLVLHTENRDILINIYNTEIDDNKKTNAKVDVLVDDFTYDGATTITYLTTTNGKDMETILVPEVKSFATKLDSLYSSNYTDSINGTLLSTTSRPNGVQNNKTLSFLAVTFVNTIDEHNYYSITPIVNANAQTNASNANEAEASASEQETTTTVAQSNKADSSSQANDNNQPADTTQTTKKDSNDDGDSELTPEPTTGDGGDDN